MPSDILGTEILEEPTPGKRAFRFVKGPVFAELLMADEINRASPRTQSALLQAMQEGFVTSPVSGMICRGPSMFSRRKTRSSRKAPIPCRKHSWTGSCWRLTWITPIATLKSAC